MEITRTQAISAIAQVSRETVQAARPAQVQAAQAEIRKAAARRQVSEALAGAILADSNVPPADISKFNVRLDIHEETGRVVAEIENKETGELLQKIPSEALLRSAVMLEQYLGTILDTPA